MSFEKPLFSSFVALLCLLSLTSGTSLLKNIDTKAVEKSYTQNSDSGLNNFPVNGLPPLTYSSKKYTFNSTLLTFFEAWNFCRDLGLRMASIENYQDHVAYKEQIAPYWGYQTVHWIAATNLGAKPDEYQKFYWITNDRPVGYISGFQNWIEGYAPDGPELCVGTILGSALWIYGGCGNFASVACEESQDV